MTNKIIYYYKKFGVKHDCGRFTFYATRLRTITVQQKGLFCTQKMTRLRSKFNETLPSGATQSTKPNLKLKILNQKK